MATLRSVLEVLKWTSCSDLCHRLNQVCSLWEKAANSDEVWDTLCEAYGCDSRDSGERGKSSFLRQYHDTTIYMLNEKWLRGFDVRKREWKPAVYVDLEIPFDKLSSLVVFLFRIVATGTDNPCTGQSALIHTTTGLITPLPNMLYPRSRHGSLLYKGTVYVFGGTDVSGTDGDTAERLDVHRPSEWVELPRLLCKLAFSSPCRKGSIAYIFGGWGTDKCQSFNLNTEIFTLLPFITPMSGYLTTAFVYDGDIYFLQSGHMGRWAGIESAPLVTWQFVENTQENW